MVFAGGDVEAGSWLEGDGDVLGLDADEVAEGIDASLVEVPDEALPDRPPGPPQAVTTSRRSATTTARGRPRTEPA
jgi:hypothetical protein